MAKGTNARKTTTRTETVSVRLEPKLRYLADLAARKQRRTVSSFVEWAVQKSLELVEIGPEKKTIAEDAEFLWDVYEADRFVKLATRLPDLLTHDEQVLWKVIDESPFLWDYEERSLSELMEDLERSTRRALGSITQFNVEKTQPKRAGLNLTKLRKHWSQLIAVAQGKAPADSLHV